MTSERNHSTILITGGTGFVGQEVVRELVAMGYNVRLLVRNRQRALGRQNHLPIEFIEGDVLKPETLPGAVSGVQAVIHLVGIIAETRHVTFEQAHREATANLLAAAKAAGVTRWLQMSALGTRAEARSRYHITKWDAEEAVRQSGLDWTIFRPSLIYGTREQDRMLKMFRTLLTWPVNVLMIYTFPFLNGGGARIQPVSVKEVAQCFARAVSRELSVGQTYDLVGPVAFSWREMITKVAAYLGRSVRYEKFPILAGVRKLLWLAIAVLPFVVGVGFCQGWLELVEVQLAGALWVVLVLAANRWTQLIVFGVPSGPLRALAGFLNGWLPRGLQFSEQVKMAEEDNVGDPLPAMKAFGYTPESFDEGLQRVLG